MMPQELPKRLPLRRAVDYAIELEAGSRPPAQAPYRMSPSELAKLRKQLNELLEADFIQPSKARMVLCSCFKGRWMDHYACVLTTVI